MCSFKSLPLYENQKPVRIPSVFSEESQRHDEERDISEAD